MRLTDKDVLNLFKVLEEKEITVDDIAYECYATKESMVKMLLGTNDIDKCITGLKVTYLERICAVLDMYPSEIFGREVTQRMYFNSSQADKVKSAITEHYKTISNFCDVEGISRNNLTKILNGERSANTLIPTLIEIFGSDII